MKIGVTIDDVRVKSNLKINQTSIFTEKSFFYTISGFNQSSSHPLDDIDGFYQLIAGSYKSEKPINITGNDKIHLKCDCINGSIVIGVTEPILFSFTLSSPPGHKIYKEPRIKLFKKINKSVLSQLTFYFKMMITNSLILMEKRLVLLLRLLKYKVYIQLFEYLYV